MSRQQTLHVVMAMTTVLVAALLSERSVSGTGPSGAFPPPPTIPCFTLYDDYEENDSFDAGSPIKLPFTDDDLLACEGDDDWFRFHAAKGAQINIHVDFDDSLGDIDIDLWNTVGPFDSSRSVTDDETISVPAPSSGEFFLVVYLADDSDDLGNFYDLDVDISCPAATTAADVFIAPLEEPYPFSGAHAGSVNCMDVAAPEEAIADLVVGLEIKVGSIEQLIVTLEHVDTGTSVTLLDRHSSCDGHIERTYFADSALVGVEEGCLPIPPTLDGSYRPHEPLAAFNGEPLSGVWRLQVTDDNQFSSGTLIYWSIESRGLSTATPTNSAATDTHTPTPETPTATPDPPPDATVTATPPGGLAGDADCSGSVNAVDAAFILQVTAGLISELPCPENADVGQDGQINTIDAALILQFTAGLLGMLPP